MSFIQKLNGIVAKFRDLEQKLLDPALSGANFAKISKEHSDLQTIVALIFQYQAKQKELSDVCEMLQITEEKEMKDLLEQEQRDLEKIIPEIEHNIKISLLPKDVADEKNAILEISVLK